FLDCQGGPYSQRICDNVETAGGQGVWLTEQELLRLAEDIQQTFEGQQLAFPVKLSLDAISSEDVSLDCFPHSQAQLALSMVDGEWMEIYAKEPEIIAAIRR